MRISCKWNITIGKCLVWLIDSSPPAMFVFVERTGHLSLKLMMRQESWCQTAVTAWRSAERRACACGWKSEYARVCVSVCVCDSVYVVLYLARRIPQKVMNPVEHEVTQSMIDMRSYFMGAARAFRWALSQFTSFTSRSGKERKRRKEREEGDKRSGEWVPGRKVTDFID